MNEDSDFFRLPQGRRAPAASAPGTSSADTALPANPPPAADAARPIPPIVRAQPPLDADPASAAAAHAPMASAPPPPAHPPQSRARRAGLWALLGSGTLALVLCGGAFGYWAFMNVAARLHVTQQPMMIGLPAQANITMRAQNAIDIHMKGTIHAQVPLQQTLDLPVKGRYDTLIDLDTRVPLETTIVYEGVIPVDTMADIEAKAPVNFQNVKKYKNLHFKAKLPMKLRLPVWLVVPVKQNIALRYKGPLKVDIDHVIRAPVGTTLQTALKVDQAFKVPVTSSLPLQLDLPQHPVRATLHDADLFLDIATLRLERKPEGRTP